MPLLRRNRHPEHRPFELNPAPVERLELETAPNAGTVASYVLTRAAERSWEILNQHLMEPGGAIFWIAGPPGCGKTHFLNYAIALQSRAGALGAENARRVVCGLEVAGRVRAAEVETYLLNVLAEQIGADHRSGGLWREMRGADALTLALESARRIGIRALTAAIDFGMSDCDSASEFFAMLSAVAAKFTALKFTVIAAGRSCAPGPARELEVAGADAAEEMAVAIRRARTLAPGADSDVKQAYPGIDTGGYAPDAIFPFHPSALRVLESLAAPAPTIASLSRLIREALSSASGDRDTDLLYPADLVDADGGRRLEARIAAPALAALKIARGALLRLGANEMELARQMVDTLIAQCVCSGDAPITLEEFQSQLPMLARGRGGDAWNPPIVRELLLRLEATTGGVVRVDGDAVRFDPGAAGAPEVAAFNSALPLARRFDPDLAPARDGAELNGRRQRLAAAMVRAVESLNRTREVLRSALDEARLPMPAGHLAAIGQYAALANRGASELVEAASDPDRRDAAFAAIDAYDALAAIAALVPRMRAMREYLDGTGLRAHGDARDGSRGGADDRAVAMLATERELLGVELGPRLLTGAARNLDALEARFHKFKWTYVQHYLEAHEQWRLEMDRLALVADDARRYAAALARLNAIAALGPSAGAELNATAADLCKRVVRCEAAAPLAPETTPRCASCGYTLGAEVVRPQLDDLMDALKRALAVKLAALSQSVIARLIRDHDREHRLDGFLKITQAAHTDALVSVLDERLARYLARLLDENLQNNPEAAAQAAPAPARALKSVKRGARETPPGRRNDR